MLEKPTVFRFTTQLAIDRATVELYVNSSEDEKQRIIMELANRLYQEIEHEKRLLICELIAQKAEAGTEDVPPGKQRLSSLYGTIAGDPDA